MKEQNSSNSTGRRTITINNNFSINGQTTATQQLAGNLLDTDMQATLYKPSLHALLRLLISVMKPVRIYLFRYASQGARDSEYFTEILAILEPHEMRTVDYMQKVFCLPSIKPVGTGITFRCNTELTEGNSEISSYSLLHFRDCFMIYKRDLGEQGSGVPQADIDRCVGLVRAHFINGLKVFTDKRDLAATELNAGLVESTHGLLVEAVRQLYFTVISSFGFTVHTELPLGTLRELAGDCLPPLIEPCTGLEALEELNKQISEGNSVVRIPIENGKAVLETLNNIAPVMNSWMQAKLEFLVLGTGVDTI